MADALSALPVEKQYSTCVAFITDGGADGKGTGCTSQPDKLAVYKWFKQVTVGDNTEPERPSYMAAVMKTGGPIAAAELQLKWDAWESAKGTGKAEAMTKYVETVVAQLEQNGRGSVLSEFCASHKDP